jgi:hypothetical protein
LAQRIAEKRPQETSLSLDLEQPETTLDSAPATETPDTPQPDELNPEASLLQQQDVPEEVEEELEGIKLRGPKEALEKIKSERLMQADYTRKTQEVAEQRRTFEQRQQQFEETAKLHQEHIREVGRLVAIDERLQQFQQVNWQQLNSEDPVRAQALLIELNQLQSTRGQLQGSLAQKEQQRQLELQQTTAKRANEAEAIVMREVKDWGPEKLAKFVDAGQKAGLQPESVRQMLIQFPEVSRFLNKALQYDQLLAQRLQKPTTPELPKPATRVGGAAAANTKPLSEVTDPREWAERRRQRKSQTR